MCATAMSLWPDAAVWRPAGSVLGQADRTFGRAVPGENGRPGHLRRVRDRANWPRPITGLRAMTSGPGARAERLRRSPNRVFILSAASCQHPRPMTIKLPQLGPNIEFPNFRLRGATRRWRAAGTSRAADGKVGDDSDVVSPASTIAGTLHRRRERQRRDHSKTGRSGQDAAAAHAVYISPLRSEKRVWIVDDYRIPSFVFSNERQAAAAATASPTSTRPTTTFLPADVHRLAAGRHVLRRRRLCQYARREVRQERQVPDEWGQAGTTDEALLRRSGRAT